MEFACRLVFQCLLLVCVVSFSTGCGPDSSGSAADSSLQAVPVSAPQNPGLAVRSDYYTAKPTKEDALMPEAIEEFGLMAPMPLSEEQLQDIFTFLGTAEFEKPGW